jgi:carbamoyltransferase
LWDSHLFTLGINAAFHDSSACLVRDGVVIAAAEEERFTGIKHAKRPVPFSTWELPFHAIDYCLREADVRLSDVDHVAYSFDPDIQLGGNRDVSLPLEPSAAGKQETWESPWEPLFLSYVVNAPRQLTGGAPHHLRGRFGAPHAHQWRFVEHHLSHGASAFLPSPFAEAAVLTLDGRGEVATTSYGWGEGASISRLGQETMPNSLGLLYERLTDYLGFLHSSDEYKVMALASYGEPRFLSAFQRLVDVGSNGRYTVSSVPLEELLGPRRERGGTLEQRHFDIAASLQVTLEESVLEMTRWLHEQTGGENLCMAGGVALNCVMNSRLLQDGPFRRIWVQPAAGDAGTALGAALWLDGMERGVEASDYEMGHAFLGPAFTDQAIEDFLRSSKLAYARPAELLPATAELLRQGKIIGWFQGRMEFGPRALGARSILASPADADMKRRLNEIKDREDFRPVAPVVLAEKAGEWFEIEAPSPFMLFVHKVRADRVERIPAVRHVDGTARVQTVTPDQNRLLHELLVEFERRTDLPVLINTSFNIQGQPIVCTPRDAIQAYAASPLDALVIGPFLLQKQAGS